MGGEISKEEIEREERIRISGMKSDLEHLTRLVQEFLRNPTAANKEAMRRAVYPQRKKEVGWDSRGWMLRK